MMGTITTNARAASDTKMDRSMADGDLDFEPPTRTVDEFRKKIMDSLKSARWSAG
jgi:hypothetical protein